MKLRSLPCLKESIGGRHDVLSRVQYACVYFRPIPTLGHRRESTSNTDPFLIFASPLSRELQSLQFLTLRDGNPEPDKGDYRDTFLHINPHLLRLCKPFRRILKLRLHNLIFLNLSDFTHLLRCFVNLQSLHLIGVRHLREGLESGYVRQEGVLKHLSSLHLDYRVRS